MRSQNTNVWSFERSRNGRSEMYKEGRIPTFRADIDYALVEAHTTYGRLGIKVWIMKSIRQTGIVSSDWNVQEK